MFSLSLLHIVCLGENRYCQEQHPDLASKVHVFNTYFYETLTRTAKGQKGINYDGVKRWTSKIDLFRYEYVIVPVNEK